MAEPKNRLRGCAWAAAGCVTVVVLTLVIGVVVVRSTFTGLKMSGASMEPTLYKGDVMLFRPAAQIRRGDLIAFLPMGKPAPFLMRVIALPGEQVELRGGYAVVNGTPLNEPYVWLSEGPGSTLPVVRDMQPMTVPPDSFYVLGDNRDNANDSRFIGFVERKHIRGRAVLVMSEEKGIWRP